mgnify:CR=1 FL=1
MPVDWLVAVLGYGARTAIVMMGSPGQRFIRRSTVGLALLVREYYMTHKNALRDHNNSKSRAVHEFSFSLQSIPHTTITTELSSYRNPTCTTCL